MDIDNTGFLTKENLARVINHDLSIGVSERFLDIMIELADGSKDGGIDLEEFEEFYQTYK